MGFFEFVECFTDVGLASQLLPIAEPLLATTVSRYTAGTYIRRIHPVQGLRHVIIHVGQPETGEADGYCLRNERLQVSFPLCIVATSSSR